MRATQDTGESTGRESEMASVTIEIDDNLLQRVEQHLASGNSGTLSALVQDLLREHLGAASDDALTQQTVQKLGELGYIDAGLDI